MSKSEDTEIFTPPKLVRNLSNNVAGVKPGQLNGQSIYPYFGEELLNILGLQSAYKSFANTIKRDGKKMKGETRININIVNSPIFVYCDIVYPSLVGDKCTKLLRIVENKKSNFGEQVFHEFKNLQYHPLALREFDTIEVDIKDEFNNTLPFKFGRSIITLHFRQRNVRKLL